MAENTSAGSWTSAQRSSEHGSERGDPLQRPRLRLDIPAITRMVRHDIGQRGKVFQAEAP